jgi:hypothetical protein
MAMAAVLAGLTGCGDSSRASVSGRITIDGRPVESGAINFFPTGDTKGPSAGASIVEGHYSISADKGVVVGENLVQIRGVRKTGKMVNSPMGHGLIEEWADQVPEKYNKRTTLSRAIEPGANVMDFELSSK